jgi:hypothetical protein
VHKDTSLRRKELEDMQDHDHDHDVDLALICQWTLLQEPGFMVA